MNQLDDARHVPAGKGLISRPTSVSEPTEIRRAKVVPVPIAALLPGESPRSQGPDQEHVTRLAEVDGPLPPILVRRSDMRVIDGTHRLLAALARGQDTIDVEYFEGSAADAFLHAVAANIAHGLPLSQADRRAAASRIIASHPHMSDRAIARASGLGAKAVASIRRRSTDALPQLNARIGRDGRVRPLSTAQGRWRAAEVMAEHPDASLREVARIAGISPATASDVRKRIQAGELPSSVRPESLKPSPGATDPPADGDEVRVPAQGGGQQKAGRTARLSPHPGAALEKLLRDPSLRLKEEGRHLLRLLQQNALAEWSDLTDAVPPHCGELVGSLARQYAATWLQFAQHLDERERTLARKTVG
ncbi:ParB N-terminal domain-containing protein [Streptomyces sp. SID7499]|uniref:ParB N-terminal domain-containing protein n=1 Tax=Streptomyces sp. SID7499 TaxID=2706086 RepID=A0A6G3XSG9_9ACTN|nr:ParB N-terminal domain-containing protein [Streptomyces sp. SID7499]